MRLRVQCSQQMLGKQIDMPEFSFHSSGRNANTPYLTRELIYSDKNGNTLYRESLINGKTVLAVYNRERELVRDEAAFRFIERAKKAGAFGKTKVTRLNPHTGKKYKKGDEKKYGQFHGSGSGYSSWGLEDMRGAFS